MSSNLPAYEKLGVFYLGRPVDPATREAERTPLLYDSKDLLTHAVCIGMTGSGKTGLCVSLLEEAALDGIPALIIDPKGDLGNLLLTFPELRPSDFEPWLDEAEATRQGKSVAQLAAEQAEAWRKGLADWDEDGERIRRFQEAADAVIYTPGSDAGQPLSLLGSLGAPKPEVLEDAELFNDRVRTLAGSLLALLKLEADPLTSREHILISNLLADRWRQGLDLDLATLIALIQKPPFERVGVLELETFFPAKERFGLAIAINNLVASPGMEKWLAGDPLDLDRILYGPTGKPRLAIVSVAHLSDAERMSFVALLLNEMVGWMRGRPGSSSLRAVVYMDEVFGYLPPVGEPPSKKPLLTLFKQARAFGVGVVLATQNPVDLDYKALSNAGTWFLGRLQTQRDKERVLEGLEGAAAAAGGGFDRSAMDQILSGLAKRMFLLHNTHESEPELMQTRWALSYLRGPMTRQEIKRVMASKRTEAAAPGPGKRAAAVASGATGAKPVLPPEVRETFLVPGAVGGEWSYRPGLLGLASVRYVDDKKGIEHREDLVLVLPFAEGSDPVDWREAETLESSRLDPERDLESEPRGDAAFGSLPVAASQAKSFKAWEKELAEALFRDRRLELPSCPALGAVARAGESERDFRIRIADAARDERDAAKEKLRQKYASKLASLEERIRRAAERVEREKEQASSSKTQTWLSAGGAIASVLFGRRKLSQSTFSKASSVFRGVSRSSKESGDVERAEESLDVLQADHQQLTADLESELATLGSQFDPLNLPLETVLVRPKKADVDVRQLLLAWIPTGERGRV